MRQGETAQKGGWIGNATGGVKAPEPILLPDPRVRFARTAERLERLSNGHPMEGWLDFMAKLARAQHRAASTRKLRDQIRLPPLLVRCTLSAE